MHEIDLDKAHREQARWRILKVLDSGRPMAVSELVILQALNDATLSLTPNGLRRELKYLEDRRLVTLANLSSTVWAAALTRFGVDVVEYTVDCMPGIARPAKWY
ncbi:hypothetical protein V3390_00175 [Luteimonas sp. FXH3W]|uniref:Uncharacterized protein n=1 Tax=Aquilutibacter rugosus TaxID=3115820 RepID=A0ABU7UWR7_9GAMM